MYGSVVSFNHHCTMCWKVNGNSTGTASAEGLPQSATFASFDPSLSFMYTGRKTLNQTGCFAGYW